MVFGKLLWHFKIFFKGCTFVNGNRIFNFFINSCFSKGKRIVFTCNHSLRSFNPYHWHHIFSKDNVELLGHHPCPVLYIIVISFINLSVNSCAIKKSFLMNQWFSFDKPYRDYALKTMAPPHNPWRRKSSANFF